MQVEMNWWLCRWKATALRQGDWESWFQTQMKTANKKPEKGLYISLRMDGRVRRSGAGSPPWDWLAVALPPVSGSRGVADYSADRGKYIYTYI